MWKKSKVVVIGRVVIAPLVEAEIVREVIEAVSDYKKKKVGGGLFF